MKYVFLNYQCDKNFLPCIKQIKVSIFQKLTIYNSHFYLSTNIITRQKNLSLNVQKNFKEFHYFHKCIAFEVAMATLSFQYGVDYGPEIF